MNDRDRTELENEALRARIDYPRAQFRPPSPAGAWSLNSGDSQPIPSAPARTRFGRDKKRRE